MASTRERILLFNIVIIIASLAITAFLAVDRTSAEPKKVHSSMSARVTAQRELCEDLGGGQMDYVNSYKDGKLVGVTTYCKGGSAAGWNCANTPDTIDCWQGPKRRTVQPPVILEDLPNITVVDPHAAPDANGEPIQATPIGGFPDGEIEVEDNLPTGDINNVDIVPFVTPTPPAVP